MEGNTSEISCLRLPGSKRIGYAPSGTPKKSRASAFVIDGRTVSTNGLPTKEILAPAAWYTGSSKGKIATNSSASFAQSFARPLRHAHADGGIYENTRMPRAFARFASRQLKSG